MRFYSHTILQSRIFCANIYLAGDTNILFSPEVLTKYTVYTAPVFSTWPRWSAHQPEPEAVKYPTTWDFMAWELIHSQSLTFYLYHSIVDIFYLFRYYYTVIQNNKLYIYSAQFSVTFLFLPTYYFPSILYTWLDLLFFYPSCHFLL